MIAFVDTLMVLFAVGYNVTLIVVYLFRAYEKERLELKLAYFFSGFLIPFTLLWLANLVGGSGAGRLLTGFPIIIFLVYDLWYRLITKKKPTHHPEQWPIELKIYLILWQMAGIGLNWYGFLVSQAHGNLVLASYFSTLMAFGYYQYRYNKKKQ